MDKQLREAIKDRFAGHGVKQKDDGRIVTYFTPDSATELVEKLTKDISTLISHERAEAVRDLLAQLGINEDSLQANGYYAIAISKEELEEYLSNEK